MAKTNRQKNPTNSLRQQMFDRRQKIYSTRELALLAVVRGLEKLRFKLYGKVLNLYTNHQALEPLIKRNRDFWHYRTRLTKWLERLTHFAISITNTAWKNKTYGLLEQKPVRIAINRWKLGRTWKFFFENFRISTTNKASY